MAAVGTGTITVSDEQIRLKCLELVVLNVGDGHVGGYKPDPAWLVAQAAQLEAYVKSGLQENAKQQAGKDLKRG